MPTVGGRRAWHFVSYAQTGGAPTHTFDVDVPNSHAWSRNVQSRLAVDPNGGAPTVVERADSATPLRRIPIPFRLPGRQAHPDGLIAKVREAIWSGSPYKLTNPRETTWVLFDPTSWSEEDQGVAWVITVTAYEVPDPTVPLPVPPIIPPGGGPVQPPAAVIQIQAMAPQNALIPFQWANFGNPQAGDFVGIFPAGTSVYTTSTALVWVSTGALVSGSDFMDLSGLANETLYVVRAAYGTDPVRYTGAVALAINDHGITQLYPRQLGGGTTVRGGDPISGSWYSGPAGADTDPVVAFGICHAGLSIAGHAFGDAGFAEVAVDGSAGSGLGTVIVPIVPVNTGPPYDAYVKLTSGAFVAYPIKVSVY
jgi:hypothetical protein